MTAVALALMGVLFALGLISSIVSACSMIYNWPRARIVWTANACGAFAGVALLWSVLP